MSDITFADLGLGPKVEAAVEASGYTTPTPIQAQAIPVALKKRDVLGIAQTGTGKTAGFTLPMITLLERGRARARMPRSLILAPTRELAAQVADSFEKYGANHKLNVALLIGGVSFDEQNKKLDRGADVLIATPGRMLDHVQRGKVLLTGIEILVIDEADRMLDMGFIPDIERICKMLPPRRQTLFFSATMPPEIVRLVDQFLKDPERIEVAPPATTAKTITQRFHFCADGEDWAKREQLRELIRGQDINNGIIFCNRKRDVAILLKSLTKHGFNAGALHGDMDQTSRMATLAAFRSGEIQLLAASDVAARGLDIPDVSHVFNFDVPLVADDYVHRIGRTGRAGREGYAATIVGPDDLYRAGDIEKVTGEPLVWIGDAPSEEDYDDASSRKKRRGRGGGSRRTSARTSGDTGEAKPTRTGAAKPRGGRGRNRRTTDAVDEAPVDAPTHAAATPAGTDQPASAEALQQHDGASPTTANASASNRRPRHSRKSEASTDAETETSRTDRRQTPPAKEPRSEKRARGRGSRQKTDEELAEASFAGNVPAFLQRPVRRATRPEPTASETSGE
ncbi:MAG: DEAD/DEAH box helicase [Pseudomonadota bacterium]